MNDKTPATRIVQKKSPTEGVKTPATRKPATRKPQKITIPRLFNAVEDIVNGAGLGMDDTIKDLYDELEAAIVKDARGK